MRETHHENPAPTDWIITLRVTLDAEAGPASLRDWLQDYADHCPRGLKAQLQHYVYAQLISNSDWDHVHARFEVTAIRTTETGGP